MTTQKEMFTNAGFIVADEQKENSLLRLIKKEYPAIIRDGEVKLDALKNAIGLPIDEKVNGYGLNFIGRNVAKAKYAQKTTKELKINETLSKNFDTTRNIVLKGDNLDCLKILKSYYGGKIKCIYIDPPYNTQSDEFVYPDKFDAEEREVLGLANIGDDDVERMEFSFGNKKSHNGWLSFMYPRLTLARDLLTEDGVIFISIDDNEQANLKLVCDEVFGEDNLISNSIVVTNRGGRDYGGIAQTHEYLIVYAKKSETELNMIEDKERTFDYTDEKGGFNLMELRNRNILFNDKNRPNLCYPFYVNTDSKDECGLLEISLDKKDGFTEVMPLKSQGIQTVWRWGKEKAFANLNTELKGKAKQDGGYMIVQKSRICEKRQRSVWDDKVFVNERGSECVKHLFDNNCFAYPKSPFLIKRILEISTISDQSDIILDFFAGSGTTAHSVMQLNAEDSGNRRFILCQIDEPISEEKKKEAFDFCVANNLPPVISSITIERLRRAGEKIKNSVGAVVNRPQNSGTLDVGFKVFDLTDAPKLTLCEEDGRIDLRLYGNAPLSRIYSMIFKVGLDDPSVSPLEILRDCVYHYSGTNNYYITNAALLDESDNNKHLSEAIRSVGVGGGGGICGRLDCYYQYYFTELQGERQDFIVGAVVNRPPLPDYEHKSVGERTIPPAPTLTRKCSAVRSIFKFFIDVVHIQNLYSYYKL